MSPPFLRRRAKEPPPPTERVEVRKYRYLLRTSPPGRLEAMHRRALESLDPAVRANILRTVQECVPSGDELSLDDVGQLALLITEGELRTPGIVIGGLSDPALHRLAHLMVTTNEAADVWEAYDTWDGVDPEPPPVAPAQATTAFQEA